MSGFDSTEFITNGYVDSNFKPKFYIIFLIIFSIYYFFAPLLSQLVLLFIENNLDIVRGRFFYSLFKKFFLPYASIFFILILYVLFVEERKISFLFLSKKQGFFSSFVKGTMFATLLLFSLMFMFVLGNDTLSVRLNRDFLFFFNFFQLVLVLIFTYLKALFLEILYRGWLINILNFRYNAVMAVLMSALVPVVNTFVEHRRIGIYILSVFLLNIFISFVFLLYKDIFIVTSFSCLYEFFKKYILAIENIDINLNPVFYTVVNNVRLYNIENSYYSCVVFFLFICMILIVYKYKYRAIKNVGQVL